MNHTATRRGGTAIAAAAAALALLAAAARAQPATPAADLACTVTPRTLAELVAAAGAPRAQPAAPVATPAAPLPASPAAGTPAYGEEGPSGPATPLQVRLPEGPPASPEAVDGMTQTMRAFVACTNAGETLRVMSLVTDDYLRRGFGNAGLTEAQAAAFVGTPRPLAPEDQRAFVAAREARVLPDGRVAALFDLAAVDGPVPGKIRTDFVVFREVGGRYLIDAYATGLPPEQFGPGA